LSHGDALINKYFIYLFMASSF